MRRLMWRTLSRSFAKSVTNEGLKYQFYICSESKHWASIAEERKTLEIVNKLRRESDPRAAAKEDADERMRKAMEVCACHTPVVSCRL